MLRFSRTGLGVASVFAIVLVSGFANAQTIPVPTATATTTTGTGTGPSISATQQANPLRFVKGQQVNQRALGLTPLGVNYQDCIDDMTLQFSVLLSGFDGTTNNVQIWATKSGDCTAPSTRGIGGGTTANTCWLVNQGLTVPNIEVGQSRQFNVRVQDLVGPQNAPPQGSNLVHEGASACTAQPSFAPVPMTIWFLAVDSAGNSNGTPFEYQIPTDLIGPPPPTGVTTLVGDTLMQVNWTPNMDGDTGGYNIFIDPIPGQEGTSATGAVASMPQLICPDSGSAVVADAAASDGASSGDAQTDAMASIDASNAGASPDAGCILVNVGGSSGPTNSQTSCPTDPILASGIVEDGGGTTTVVPSSDDASDDAAGPTLGTTVVATGGGGISTIPTSHIVNPNVATGETVTGETNANYTLKGLKNQVPYNIVVAAVDNSGNTGPPSLQACGTPAPIDDFWKIYREDGGTAGGFCALEAAGAPAGSTLALVGAGALALGAVGRRRRRRAR